MRNPELLYVRNLTDEEKLKFSRSMRRKNKRLVHRRNRQYRMHKRTHPGEPFIYRDPFAARVNEIALWSQKRFFQLCDEAMRDCLEKAATIVHSLTSGMEKAFRGMTIKPATPEDPAIYTPLQGVTLKCDPELTKHARETARATAKEMFEKVSETQFTTEGE